MLILTCSSKLAAVRQLLTHSFPESLKACGALHHVINGNPFKLEVLIDQWPDFSTVICRPSLEDMKDPLDNYTNTYFLFSKDTQNLRQMLDDPQVVNWSQDLQINGCQPALGGVLQEVSFNHGRQMHTTSNFLYMTDRMRDEEQENINSIRMLVLTCYSKLAALRRLLTHSFPDSLKACGALHHVINGNPFKLEVLVDQWPDFSTVICRPSLEDMKDPSDHYTNTYFLYSKDHQHFCQMLEDPQVVNWNQDLQIQGCQPSLGGVVQEVISKHRGQMHMSSNLLFMRKRMADEELEKINRISSNELRYTPLLVHEAPLVNNKWAFGMNHRSLRFIECCIQNLPTICVRKKGLDEPIAWGLTENSAEIRMGYTIPAYRNLGFAHNILLNLAAANYVREAPIYVHVTPDNVQSKNAILNAGFQLTGTWEQYYFKQKS